MPAPRNHPDQHAYPFATFPPRAHIPEAARAEVEAFLALRRRHADASRARDAAAARLEPAKLEDAAALREHVADGGSAATFKATAVPTVQQGVAHATTDLAALDELLQAQYVTTVYTLQAVADDGQVDAQRGVEAAHGAYLDAIRGVEQARRDYLGAVGLQLFWSHLVERHAANAGLAAGDQIVTPRGAVTRVDGQVFKAMRSDAQAHNRVAGREVSASDLIA